MAFTESEKLKIAKILNTNFVTVNDQLTNLGTDYITAAVETAVRAEITRWDAGAGSDFVSVEPNTANYGARIDPDLEKQDIRQNIANLLYLFEFAGSAGNSVTLLRG